MCVWGGGGGRLVEFFWTGEPLMNKKGEMSTGEAFINLYIREAFIGIFLYLFLKKN